MRLRCLVLGACTRAVEQMLLTLAVSVEKFGEKTHSDEMKHICKRLKGSESLNCAPF